MQGMIISNPKLEFLRPLLERWFDCIDRYNAVRGDNDTPYWYDEKANLGLLSAAAWMAARQWVSTSSANKAPIWLTSPKPYMLKSVALGQLINLYSPDAPIKSSAEYLAVSAGSVMFSDGSLEPIQVTYRDVERINWLSAFYFLEWMLFAGFAVFLWWRLVKDAQLIEQNETVN